MGERSVKPRDLLQAPTGITLGSFALVCHGAKNITSRTGKIEIAAGRMGDVVDGYVARRFNMSSDAGAIADVTCDKVGMAIIGASLLKNDIAPKPVLAAIAARNIVNAGATLYHGFADDDHRAIRPPKSGKYAMAAENMSLGAFMLADELKEGSCSKKIVRGIGYAAATAGIIFGIHATKGYIEGNFDEATS